MSRDSRNLSVDVDAEHLWRALQAIEDVASEVIEGRDTYGMKCEYKVTHGGGSYHRSALNEAESVANRNGFEVDSIRFAISKTKEGSILPFDPRLQWIEGRFEYYTPEWKVTKSQVAVTVTENTEVEVNGVTEMLRAALCAVAPQQSEEADASADTQPAVAARESWPAPHADVVVEAIRERPTAPSAISQVMKDMWTITIVGGLVVTIVGAVILRLIYG